MAAKKRKSRKSIPDKILFNRAEAARYLGTSTRTIRRLEQDYGLLTPVRITPFTCGPVGYRREELDALADGKAMELAAQ